MSNYKVFKLVNREEPAPSTSQQPSPTNWQLCVLCQEDKSEALTCPSLSKRADKGSGYSSLATNLIKFHELGQLPIKLQLERLDEGHGIEFTLNANNAQYHQSCRLKYNNTKLQRVEKRALETEEEMKGIPVVSKRTRSHFTENIPKACFFCGQPPGAEGLHEAATLQVDSRVRACASVLGDTDLLAQLSAADMVALGAKYHTKCLLGLYNRARQAESERQNSDHERDMAGLAFAELVLYIEEVRFSGETAPVFQLADLIHLYQSKMEHLGFKSETRIHSTRLKHRLLTHFPDMQAHTNGRDILMAFKKDAGVAVIKACELDSDTDAVHLARAAQIVRRQMFGAGGTFRGFPEGCQEESVPPLLLALVSMILEGPSIKDQMTDTTPAALAIAQVMKFNAIKVHRKHNTTGSTTTRRSVEQETPVPMYIGMMLHAHTRKRELVDRLSHLGLSISYDRVLSLSTQIGNTACEQFCREQVVCPPKMRGNVFTTAAVDNIDHNPSSTTAKESFHGTAISLLQHPSFPGEGVDRSIVISGRYDSADSKVVRHLPNYYTDVRPVATNIKKASVSVSRVPTASLTKKNYQQHIDEEYLWLHQNKEAFENNISTDDNISWAAYHANRQPPDGSRTICHTALLPLFTECAHTVAMVRHSMDVVRNAIEHLNPGQTPIITFDQPLFALAKQIQWTWPEQYGEERILVMFGGLRIELAALKTLGNWLQGSGWKEALIQAEIASPGTADSFLHATHVARTRAAHQVSASALYILQQRAYNRYYREETEQKLVDFEEWCRQKIESSPQFQYWATVMDLELLLLVFVRSLRQASFPMYMDALTGLACWFHALDHTNYARWIPVHLKDMAELQDRHPEVAREFAAGNFTVQKTKRVFSSIAIDQAHEQNNAWIKGDGGAVGLTEKPNALRRWMVSGPEVARAIEEFHDQQQHSKPGATRHHDQDPSVQAKFSKDVRSLVDAIEELGNPFQEDSTDLVVLDTKEIAGPTAVEAVRDAKRIGQEQFEAFVKERLVEMTKPLDDAIHHNKLKVFYCPKPKSVGSNAKQQIACLKNDIGLFSRLYIGCQTRNGDLDQFFSHENQACPPALSDGGNLRQGTKSDLLACLKDISAAMPDAPVVTCVILDGAAIVQMLKPTTAKTFAEYAHEIFVPYICAKFHDVLRVDLVWDRYVTNSLKGSTRARRGKGVRRRVAPKAAIPGNWQDFLRVDENKTEIFRFLSQALFQCFNEEGKQLVITDGENILSQPSLTDVEALTPCNHEEADTRMLLHASHASKHGHHKIMIRTVDTDVVVLGVSVAQGIQPEDELWLAFGVGKNMQYLPAHKIAAGLGPQKSKSLPVFHALTGCDTASSFAGHGKKTAWAMWEVFPELTDALLKLSSAPQSIPPDVLHTIARFVILWYDRTSSCTDIDKARKKMFTKKNNVLLIPPTKAALEEHVKRAAYQGGHVWGQAQLPAPELPVPTGWGWRQSEDGVYEPYWSQLPHAAASCAELVSCKCKKACVKRCRCRKAALPCTALCECEGECTQT